MHEPLPRRTPGATFAGIVGLAAAALAAAACAMLWSQSRRLDEQDRRLEGVVAVLEEVLGEVTRTRLEQTASAKGPQGLMEKLRTFAPILTNSRISEPDRKYADGEMKAILRAFESIGKDCWPLITKRLGELRGDKDFDEVRWLLEAAVRIDAPAGKEILKECLLGLRLPAPRLRWHAARVLTDMDRPLAQILLRQILATESSRGINPERAAAMGIAIPDPAAYATTGFHNFVVAYVRSEDPKMDDTLLMVIGRVEHDLITIQECVEALGKRRCARALEPIKKLYESPPVFQENPIFLARCLDAIVEIERANARAWLEAQLPKANNEVTAKHIQTLLNKIERNDF
jgi:hypothetical protein